MISPVDAQEPTVESKPADGEREERSWTQEGEGNLEGASGEELACLAFDEFVTARAASVPLRPVFQVKGDLMDSELRQIGRQDIQPLE